MQYEVDRRGLKWTCKMVVQVPEASLFPELFIGDATVSKIQIGEEQVQFANSEKAGRKGRLQLELLSDPLKVSDGLLDVVVIGYSHWKKFTRLV